MIVRRIWIYIYMSRFINRNRIIETERLLNLSRTILGHYWLSLQLDKHTWRILDRLESERLKHDVNELIKRMRNSTKSN